MRKEKDIQTIYEKALDILMDSLQDPQDEDDDCYMLDFKQLNNIDKTLKQAQKQEKLLELYKKLNNLYEKLYTMELSELSLNSNYYQIEIIKLKQQIKELENEIT